MTTTSQPGSAKIYEFPRRTLKDAIGPDLARKPAQAGRLQSIKSCEFGSGWYHEAAVREADQGSKS